MARRKLLTHLLPRRRFLAGGRVLERGSNDMFLESIFVIGLIAVLLTAAFNSYKPFLYKAAVTEAQNLMRTFETDIAVHYAATGELPDAVYNGESASRFGARYFDRIDWREQEIVLRLTADFANSVSQYTGPIGTADEFTISFRIAEADAAKRRLLFLCGRAAAPQGYSSRSSRLTTTGDAILPLNCRS